MSDDVKNDLERIFMNKQGEIGVFSGNGDIVITFSVDDATIGTSLGVEEARILERGLVNAIANASTYEHDEEELN